MLSNNSKCAYFVLGENNKSYMLENYNLKGAFFSAYYTLFK